jgi:UDPglucose 6-dehydrogenase
MISTLPKILIVGYGFVGKATQSILHLAFDVEILDPAKDHPWPQDVEPWLQKFDAIFLCLPTPTVESKCDYSLVEAYVRTTNHLTCPIIIRSTIPPSAIDFLLTINPDLVYFPEFLREKTWDEDVRWPEFLIMGSNNNQHVVRLQQILRKSDSNCKNVLTMTPQQASLFKYVHNTFLATKVVFFHELFKWLSSIGKEKDFEAIQYFLEWNPKVGQNHTKAPGDHGLGYAGSCFPKDMLAFATEAGGALTLLEAAIKSNERLRDANPQEVVQSSR